MSNVYIVNDALAQGAGQSTLWHHLVSWFNGEFIGGEYSGLGNVAAEKLAGVSAGVCVRNASWFPAFDCAIPVISLLQDVLPEGHPGRPQQVEVCQRSALIVANSRWTLSQYPELTGLPTKIIPLPVDFHVFRLREDADALRTKWNIRPGSVCWVGSGDVVKGYDILHRLIGQTGFNYVVVRKDKVNGPDWPDAWGGRCRNFGQLPQADLAEIMGACAIGLVTSRAETQHLAGIEMAACGLNVVFINPVGVYADGPPWSIPATGGTIIEALKSAIGQHESAGVAAVVREGPWSIEACRSAWTEAVASVR